MVLAVRALKASLALPLLLAACDGGTPGVDAGPTDAGPYDAGPRPAFSPAHTFPAITVEPGDDLQGLCQSWTLNNPEPLWVSAVVMDAGEGWHHSNWMFVPETAFDGPDGTWPCSERMFNEISGALAGGAVFFAQSTQATHEEMRFRAGAAYEIPPYSRVIGGVHLLNFGTTALSSAVTFTIESLPSASVTTPLYPLAIDNRGIRVPARAGSSSVTDCDFTTVSGGMVDWSIYYVLPHYHGYATGWTLEALGGPMDGASIYSTSLDIGDPLGAAIDPPFDLTGATGLRLRCDYMNTTDTEVTYGSNGTDEMCVMLAYTTAGVALAGQATTEAGTRTLPDGSLEITSECFEISRRVGR
jgi:hypothetical protein